MSDPISSGDNLLSPGRRQLLLAPLLAALPLGLSARQPEAINPAETQVTLPDQIKWTAWTAGPPHSAEMATLFGGNWNSSVKKVRTSNTSMRCDGPTAWTLWKSWRNRAIVMPIGVQGGGFGRALETVLRERPCRVILEAMPAAQPRPVAA